MAESEIEAFNALHKLLAAASTEGVEAADQAAAEVYLGSAKAAAPVDSAGNPFGGRRNVNAIHQPGQLQASVKIIKSSKTQLLSSSQGNVSARIFVGPEKRMGYYGFFIEHGWIAVGPRRRERNATNTTHSQRGVTGGHKIPGRPWFDPAIQAAESAAVEAAQAAFDQKLQDLDSRG